MCLVIVLVVRMCLLLDECNLQVKMSKTYFTSCEYTGSRLQRIWLEQITSIGSGFLWTKLIDTNFSLTMRPSVLFCKYQAFISSILFLLLGNWWHWRLLSPHFHPLCCPCACGNSIQVILIFARCTSIFNENTQAQQLRVSLFWVWRIRKIDNHTYLEFLHEEYILWWHLILEALPLSACSSVFQNY